MKLQFSRQISKKTFKNIMKCISVSAQVFHRRKKQSNRLTNIPKLIVDVCTFEPIKCIVETKIPLASATNFNARQLAKEEDPLHLLLQVLILN
jgi:hypothetical protein